MNARLFVILASACALQAADDVPGWLRDLAGTSLPQYGPKVNALVLLNEESTVVSDSGKLTTTTRTALKFLNRAGADASFIEQYDTSSDKVRDFRAWMIPVSGKIKKYGKDEIFDVACAPNDVYNECRRRVVSGKRDADTGAVFAYEAIVERQSFSNQLMFHFQDAMPVKTARFVVTAPSGWELKTVSFNGAPKEPVPSGATYTWQMENLPPIEPEPASPSPLALVPWVGVNLIGGGKRPVITWADAAKLLAQLNEGTAEPNEAIAAKARSLTEGARTDLEKIRMLGKFVQQVNYVSVQVNLSSGGGYRPHGAPEVFQKLYGDCKDKANLLRAMLKSVGITAYPVAIYSGDRTHVSEEWPSLGDFNHAISAIHVGPDARAPAVLDHPKLGRLLLFDSTDPYVPAGYLPDHEQGSLALIGAPEAGVLVRVPASPPLAAERTRRVEAALKSDGSIEGSFTETLTGEARSNAISSYRAQAKPDYIKSVERWVGRSVGGASTSGVEVEDGDGTFVLRAHFASSAFAQRPQARTMIFPAALLRHNELHFSEKTRKYPVVVDADALEETVRIQLPPDFKVDELADPVHIDSPFGKFEAAWKVESSTLVFHRKLEIPVQTVDSGRYQQLRKFLDSVAGFSNLPVVLAK